MKYIVELEPHVFLAPWKGDPGRTLVERQAKRYPSVSSATFALAHARKYRNFPDAAVCEVKE